MNKLIRIGTRDSPLAIWQAKQVMQGLSAAGYTSELVFVKSEGDIDLHTPLYEMGIQGIFTRTLDSALLNNSVDIAVHSMKDVPTILASGLTQLAVLKRGPVNDLLVFKDQVVEQAFYQSSNNPQFAFTVATSSLRRKAQWLHRFPHHRIESLRGNISTRLQKLQTEPWQAAIFAQAGLERINLRPAHSIELEWLLPAPAQGAIMVVGRNNEPWLKEACTLLNDETTELCTRIEREFLRTLLGGCSAPIAAHAHWKDHTIEFEGNILSVDGKEKKDIKVTIPPGAVAGAGKKLAEQLLLNGGQEIMDKIRNSE